MLLYCEGILLIFLFGSGGGCRFFFLLRLVMEVMLEVNLFILIVNWFIWSIVFSELEMFLFILWKCCKRFFDIVFVKLLVLFVL